MRAGSGENYQFPHLGCLQLVVQFNLCCLVGSVDGHFLGVEFG
jgi:hypothetical protein